MRIVIFEDNKLVREAMQVIINGTPGLNCTGAYADVSLLDQKIKASNPDVALMDIEMPGMSGIDATKILHDRYPDVKVLIQTVFNESEKIFMALAAGASGYILKGDPPAKQIEAIQEVYHGGAPMSPSIAKKVLDFFSSKNVVLVSPEPNDYDLSKRELEILMMMTEGNNYRTIAGKAFISYETVRTHVKKIYKKLHVASRAEAVLKASQQRIV